MEWNIACETCFNPLKPCVVKTEFLPTISKKYQADKWWQWRKILIMQGITSWSNAKILQKDITGIVWRITNEVLGLKGLTKLALFSWGKKNQASGNPLNDLLVLVSNGNIFQFKVIRVNPPSHGSDKSRNTIRFKAAGQKHRFASFRDELKYQLRFQVKVDSP